MYMYTHVYRPHLIPGPNLSLGLDFVPGPNLTPGPNLILGPRFISGPNLIPGPHRLISIVHISCSLFIVCWIFVSIRFSWRFA